MNFSYILLFSLFYIRIDCNSNPENQSLITNETKAEEYLKKVNKKLGEEYRKYSESQWNYASNITNATSLAQIKAIEAFNAYQKFQSIETKKYDWSHFTDYNRRQFEKLAVIGTSALEGKDGKTFTEISTQMETIYSSATVCLNGKCGLELDPDLDEIMSKSKNYTELTEVWVKWRDASGKRMRNKYITYYTLGNKAAKLNKIPNKEFNTLDDLWLFGWETDDLKEQTANLWKQLKPFYEKIHAYVRIHLKKAFPKHMPKDGTIPANLLGNMWAQQWSHIMNTVDGVDPYPEKAPIDVTQALKDQAYNSTKMFELSEKFFVDLGLERMTEKFWRKSIFDKPKDGTIMICHASAWDFYTDDDFRIKMCTNIDMEDLITIHHEMGHIQYYMQYKDQPVLYREGANPGFHEAIGDLLALSVSTPKHLKKIKLLKMDESEDMAKINIKFQLMMALDKVAFLPFGYIMDKWRWDLFSGDVSSNHMNRHWWQLRGQYQGLSPPVTRSEQDFDPGAKYHIPSNVEYIRYFVSHILQFQFHKSLCGYSQKDVPLHECDIDGDKEAGNKLKQMLEMGSSKPWPELLEQMTGNKTMDIQPLLQYFQPLHDFLDVQLKNEKIGWNFNVDNYFTSGSSDKTFINTLLLSMSAFISFALFFT